jgi:hypothetical protein
MVGSSRANLQCLPAASRGSLISEKSVTVGHDESKKSCSLEQKSVCFQKLIDSGAWHALLLWRLTMKHKKGLERALGKVCYWGQKVRKAVDLQDPGKYLADIVPAPPHSQPLTWLVELSVGDI